MRISDWSSDVCSSDLHDEATDQADQEDPADDGEAALDELLDRRAEAPQQAGNQEKPYAAGGDRGDDENHKIEMRGTAGDGDQLVGRSEEHTSELQSLMRNSYAVFCLQTNKKPHVYQSKPQ